MKYNAKEGVYLFEFPDDQLHKYFYTYAELTLSGTNTDDNVKFCFTTSIGGALKPSSENCYRVSKTNSYRLKVYNPFIMYKNYTYREDFKYSVTLKPVTEFDNFGILVRINTYDTNIRNYEDVNNKIDVTGSTEYSAILTPSKEEIATQLLQIQVCEGENKIKTIFIRITNKKNKL